MVGLRRPEKPHERIIVALDVADEPSLTRLAGLLRGRVGLAKVGKELFTALGPVAVERVRDHDLDVFLDLKFHDIPNTVGGAVRAARRMGVAMLTVYASGGRAILAAAVEAARGEGPGPVILAVTLLTSMGLEDMGEVGLSGEPAEAVERLAGLALGAGVDGLVCSPREVTRLREKFGPEPLLVTPGVRPAGSSTDDQTRVATPARAVADGADYLVIGRPITRADDPAKAVSRIVRELGES